MNIIDHEYRVLALDPQQSFIVQAPAGSGKTEILTQRFLRLLSCVEKPEEIVAITFTRKAAAEMRGRILSALTKPQKLSAKLAEKALEQDGRFQWNLIQNPNRLRIMTIDSLCNRICAQTPILSRLGGNTQIAEDSVLLYRLATQEFLKNTDHSKRVQKKIQSLLLHLDNRVFQLEALLCQILAKREQWLTHIFRYRETPGLLKKHLEKALENVFLEAMRKLEKMVPSEMKNRLIKLVEFSKSQLSNLEENIPLSHKGRGSEENSTLSFSHKDKKNSFSFPAKSSDESFFSSSLKFSDENSFLLPLPEGERGIWIEIANLLLTQTGTFRKSVNKNLGFPPKHTMKIELENLLESFSEDEGLRHALHELQQCPPTFFSEKQWEIIDALLIILPELTAQLHVIFAEHSTVDFVELNLRASFALGSDENPTELALYLDHQIRHLLVDEFQDTSVTQYQLIEKLISSWIPGDGRSIFLVGDPMQSIYRFREANVGLFLRAQTQGIGPIPLTFIPLRCNFRSDNKIVDWLNNEFPSLFPAYSDMNTGAVPYSFAQATQNGAENAGVYFHAVIDEKQEADSIAKIIRELKNKNSAESIAILVRSRAQLQTILPTLAQHRIFYSAIEIESLENRPEIQDLFTLSCALLHFGDRLAWLSLLRAPFCGLALADLHAIAVAASQNCIWDILSQKPLDSLNLSPDALLRLQRIIPILNHSFQQKGRIPIAQWIEATWLALSGPQVLTHKNELENARVFFKTVAQLDQSSTLFSLSQLRNQLSKMSATPNSLDANAVQVMTIHKSKGLEFDHVFLPGLSRGAVQDQSQILLWLERINYFGKTDLLLGPIKSSEDESDPIYAYLRKIEKNKAQHELTRLLYVAITRAKLSVHCLAVVKKDVKNPAEFAKPSKGSFLDLLWKSFEEKLPTIASSEANVIEQHVKAPIPLFSRLLENKPVPYKSAQPERENPIENLEVFQANTSSIVGTLIHLALEKLSVGKTFSKVFWLNQALSLGLPMSEFESAFSKIQKAIENTLNDEKGRWILQTRPSAVSEYPITHFSDDQMNSFIVDRTFCDEEGTRWIIDYKTSIPKDDNLDAFFRSEAEKYRPQLEQYAETFAKMDPRPIRLALYFPLISGGFYAL